MTPESQAALTPFLPCEPDEADSEDWNSAVRVLLRNMGLTIHDLNWTVDDFRKMTGRNMAPSITPLVHEIGLDRINAKPPACFEAVVEILEYLSDYMFLSDVDTAMWLRMIAERELVKRFGRDRADTLLRRYVDPAPPGEPPYGDDGVLKAVNLSERRVVPWLVNGLVQSGTVGMWIGPYSCGKTFGALSLALSLAFDREWMGREVEAGSVHYVAAEGLLSFDKRLAGWLVQHGELPESFTRAELAGVLDGRLTLSGGNLRLDDPKLEAVLTSTIRENKTRLLVLDTLGRLLGTDQQEDSNDAANAVMGTLQRVATATACTILITHHPGHTNTHRGRGGSAWAQAADFVLVSQGDLRSGGSVRLMNTKQRDAELFEDAAYRLRSLAVTCDGEAWQSAVFEPAPLSTANEISLATRIRHCVQANPGASMREVRALVTGSNSEIGDEVIRLVADGKLENRGSGNSYSLHDAPDMWTAAEEFGTADLSDLTQEEN